MKSISTIKSKTRNFKQKRNIKLHVSENLIEYLKKVSKNCCKKSYNKIPSDIKFQSFNLLIVSCNLYNFYVLNGKKRIIMNIKIGFTLKYNNFETIGR